jgi:hypothetical protein
VAKLDENRWVRLRAFEVELALEAAFELGRHTLPPGYVTPTWSNQTQAYVNGAEEHKRVERELRQEVLATNLKVLNGAGQALTANGQALEAVARLVDNMGRL